MQTVYIQKRRLVAIIIYTVCHSVFTDIPTYDNGCFVRVEVLRPSQPDEGMSSAVSLPKREFTGQA